MRPMPALGLAVAMRSWRLDVDSQFSVSQEIRGKALPGASRQIRFRGGPLDEASA